MENTLVQEIMIPGLSTLTASEDEPVEIAIKEFLAQPEVHTLFIVGKDGKLKGAVKLHYILNWVKLRLGLEITDRTSVRTFDSLQAFEVVKLCQSQTIGDILSPSPEIKPTATLDEALHVMVLEQVTELPVVNGSDMYMGEIRLTQLLSKMLESTHSGPLCQREV
jgi:CBS domain-containing protein